MSEHANEVDGRDGLPAEALYQPCDPRAFGFDTTADLDEQHEAVGQARAVEAIELGASAQLPGYNVFVLGPSGTGRHSFVQRFLAECARHRPTPSDWCYVNNFDAPESPATLALPAGLAPRLRDDMKALIEDLGSSVPAAFDSDDYRRRHQAIEQSAQQRQGEQFEAVRAAAAKQDIRVAQTPTGFSFIPLKDGKPIGADEFEALDAEEQAERRASMEAVGEMLQASMRDTARAARDVRSDIQQLDAEVANYAVGSQIEELRERYREFEAVTAFLQRVQADVIENIVVFRSGADSGGPMAALQHAMGGLDDGAREAALRRYRVNVLVTHDADSGAPVITQDRPGFAHLFGKVEHYARFGALHTDFNLIRPGALHRANGGFLVLDARKVLTEPFAWEALKLALRSRAVRIESYAEAWSPIRTQSLDPEPIPLSVKVILVGERRLYYLLQALDPEFAELFKVAADFDDQMPRTTDNQLALARVIGGVARRESLLPLRAAAVGRMLEQSAREAGDAERLSGRLGRSLDLMRESHFWASSRGAEVIERDDVDRALDAHVRRHRRIRDRLLEQTLHGTLMIDTEGAAVGQVNGLSVLSTGDFSFGRPSRITARVALGTGKVIDIEREVELGGPLHSKGVLILSGYLAARYGTRQPLSLSATLVFEQSYGGVEGDSASSAELYALLSALSGAPISQSLAVTGSVNQLGDVQAIGGVNEKIEGFFDLCSERGLDGSNGVLVPAANVRHLMLRADVVDAARDGSFHVHPVHTIDEGLHLLTGIEAGAPDAAGAFPAGSVNERVVARLQEFSELRRRFAQSDVEKSPT